MPWWGDFNLAQIFATLAGDQLGKPNGAGSYGPLFAYVFDRINLEVGFHYLDNNNSVADSLTQFDTSNYFAIAEEIPPQSVPTPFPCSAPLPRLA